MNKLERGGGEDVVEYLDSNLRLVKPGAFVRCAVTGEPIPLDQLQHWSGEVHEAAPTTRAGGRRWATRVPIPLAQLKYWSVELQEAYSSPEAVLKRLGASLRHKAP